MPAGCCRFSARPSDTQENAVIALQVGATVAAVLVIVAVVGYFVDRMG
jgi:hypothetical protein